MSGFNRRLEAAPHCQVLLGLHVLAVILDSIYPLKVLRDGLVHLVPVADELLIYDN